MVESPFETTHTLALCNRDGVGFFRIEGKSVQINKMLDFENPQDADKDNVYHICLRATNEAGESISETFDVTITDVEDTDTDGDGNPDWEEVSYGTDPLNSLDYIVRTDVDNNGTLQINDVVLLQRFVTQLDMSQTSWYTRPSAGISSVSSVQTQEVMSQNNQTITPSASQPGNT